MNEDYDEESEKLFKLIKDSMRTLQGKVTMKLGGVSATIKKSDSMGNVIEEWLEKWAKKNGIKIKNPGATQTFPDYFIGTKQAFLEVKTWRFGNTPAFDLANFDSYCNTLVTFPEKIYSDYLILGYSLENGNLEIKDIFLKKIWEITRPMGKDNYPLFVQTKRNIIYNIRPSNFHSKSIKDIQPFMDREKFVEALYKTKDKYTNSKDGTKQMRQFNTALKRYNQP